jgi:hypothetical protein
MKTTAELQKSILEEKLRNIKKSLETISLKKSKIKKEEEKLLNAQWKLEDTISKFGIKTETSSNLKSKTEMETSRFTSRVSTLDSTFKIDRI